MEQARLVKALEPDAEWARDADKDAAVWAVRMPQVRVANACARSVESRLLMWLDNPVIK